LRVKAAQIAQAEAEVLQARGGLQAAETAMVLAAIQVEETEAALKRAQAAQEFHEAKYHRLKRLLDSKAIEPQLLDESRHQLESARAGVAEAEAKVKAAKAAREGSLAKRDIVQAQVKVALARLEVAKADAQRVDSIRQYSKILAPFDGVVI